ncbi:hypothetical protein SSP35_19_01010 [Streptomyces sp. NBRC 110611]|nr:hypothetical protein SSP35_19_01010 [Streptomyces sp. NBRC 110611]
MNSGHLARPRGASGHAALSPVRTRPGEGAADAPHQRAGPLFRAMSSPPPRAPDTLAPGVSAARRTPQLRFFQGQFKVIQEWRRERTGSGAEVPESDWRW